jgi:uncharacterized protein YdeI (YjbR/CyaY-like superfamily)
MEGQAFFKNAKSFRDWLAKNHHEDQVLWVCFYKKHTKRTSITWEESVAEALCYGWIDGLRRTIDEESYRIRFTPRRKNSIWSRKNIYTVETLVKQKRMMPAGIQAFKRRKEHKSSIYTYEKEHLALSKEYNDALKADKSAWAYYNNLTPAVKKQSINWIMSAKKQETRDRRFAIFLESCGASKLIPVLEWTRKK